MYILKRTFLYENFTHSQNEQVFRARILRYCPQIAFQKLCLANRCQSSRLCMRPLTPSICIYSMLYLQAQKYISLSTFVKRETSNLCSLFLPSYYSHKYRNYQFVKSDVIQIQRDRGREARVGVWVPDIVRESVCVCVIERKM